MFASTRNAPHKESSLSTAKGLQMFMYEADIYLNGPENDAWELNAQILPRTNKCLRTSFPCTYHVPY